mgnify:CR=1 FL=1
MLQLKNKSETENNYKTVAKFFHWSMALLIIVNYILGLTLDSTSWYLVHKQIGITILFLCILRICWRIFTPYPPLVKELSILEKFVAKCGHLFLYLLLVIIPLSGILMVQHHGYSISFWGLFNLPVIHFRSVIIMDNIGILHLYLAHLIIIIAALHALFALKHHFVNKDRTLLRMLSK